MPNLFKRSEGIEYELGKWMRILFWEVIILFSIVTTKIIHYSSMTYLPLSFLGAYTLYQASEKQIILSKVLRAVFLIVGLIVDLFFVLSIHLTQNPHYIFF